MKKKAKNLDNFLYIRINSKEKEMISKMAKFYGMPNSATFVRELIKANIEKYEDKIKE